MAHAITQPSQYVIYAHASTSDTCPPKLDFWVDINQRMGGEGAHLKPELHFWIATKCQHLNNFTLGYSALPFIKITLTARMDRLAVKSPECRIYNEHIG